MTYEDLAGEYDVEIAQLCESGRVGSFYACPHCGEDREELLIWDYGSGRFRCNSCGRIYNPLS